MRIPSVARSTRLPLFAALAAAATLVLGSAENSTAGQFDAFQVTHVRKTVKIAAGEAVRVVVRCADGQVATGGGVRIGKDVPLLADSSTVTADGRGWETVVEHLDEDETGRAPVTVTAVCANGYVVAESQTAQRRR